MNQLEHRVDRWAQTWITALQAMYLIGEFEPGKSILWHAGASSVSIAGQQLSKANGASAVFATARSDEKCEFCVKELGAKAAYNTKTEKWDELVLRDSRYPKFCYIENMQYQCKIPIPMDMCQSPALRTSANPQYFRISFGHKAQRRSRPRFRQFRSQTVHI